MAKVLIVYYSLTGNTKYIAEIIGNELNADVEEVKPIKDLDPNSSSKYLWGGMKATMKSKPTLEELTYNPSEYDLIVIGTPVWAWTLSPAIRAYCTKFDLGNKHVALFTSSSGDGVKAMRRFKDFMKNCNIISENRFCDPLTNNPEQMKDKAAEWAKELISKV